MIIKIFDCTIQKIGLPTDGIIISKWAYGHILNWKDEERLEKLYKEYGDKNLEYLEMEIIEENPDFYTIKNKEIKDIETLSKAFCEDLQNIKKYKKDKRIMGNVGYFIDYFAREKPIIIPVIIKE
mgnify:FL=1|jgi:uncharacterized hydantoinase/oxoprolinase family protein